MSINSNKLNFHSFYLNIFKDKSQLFVSVQEKKGLENAINLFQEKLSFNSNSPIHLVKHINNTFIDCVIDEQGNITQLKLSSDRNIAISTLGKIKVKQLQIKGNLELEGECISNKGTIHSDQSVEIFGRQGFKNKSGACIEGQSIKIKSQKEIINVQNSKIHAENNVDIENENNDLFNQGEIQSHNNISIKSRHINNEHGKIDATNKIKITTLNIQNQHGLILSINDIYLETLESFRRTGGIKWSEREQLIQHNSDILNYGLLNNNEGVIRANRYLNVKAYGAISNEHGLMFSGKKATLISDWIIRNKNHGRIKSREKVKIVAAGAILNQEDSKIIAKTEIKIESKESFFSNRKGKIRAGTKLVLQSHEKIDNTEGKIHSIGKVNIHSLASYIFNQQGEIESEDNLILESVQVWNTKKGLIKAANLKIINKENLSNIEGEIQASEFIHINAHSLDNSKGSITAKKINAVLGTQTNKNLAKVAKARTNPYHHNQNDTTEKPQEDQKNREDWLGDLEGYLINTGGNIFGNEKVAVLSKGEIFNSDKGRIVSQGNLKLQAAGRIFNDHESMISGVLKVNLVSSEGCLFNDHKSQIKAGSSLKTKAIVLWNVSESVIEANRVIKFEASEVRSWYDSKIISTQNKIDFHSLCIENIMSQIHAANGLIFSKLPQQFSNFGSNIESLADLTFDNLIISSWPAYQKTTDSNKWLNANAADDEFKKKYKTYIENGSDGKEVDGFIFYKPGTISTNSSLHISGDESWFRSFGGNLFAGKEISLTTKQKYFLDDIDAVNIKCQQLCIKTLDNIINNHLFNLPYFLSLEARNFINYNELESKGKIKITVTDEVIQNEFRVKIFEGHRVTEKRGIGWIKAHRGLTVRAHKINNYAGKISCIGKCHLYADQIQWSTMQGRKSGTQQTQFMWQGPLDWSGRGFSNLGGGPVEAPFSFTNGSLKDCNFLAVDGSLKVITMRFDNFGGFIMATQPSTFSAFEYLRNHFGRFFIIGDTIVKAPQFVNVMLFDTPSSTPAYFNVEGKLTLQSIREGFNISSNLSARDGIWMKGLDLTKSSLPSSFVNQTHPTVSEVVLNYDRKSKGYVVERTVGVFPQPLASISSAHSINVDLSGFMQNIGIMHAPDIDLNATGHVHNNLVRSSAFSSNIPNKSLPNRIPFIDLLREQSLDSIFQISNNPISQFVIEPVIPFSLQGPLPNMLIVHRPEKDPQLETLKPMISPAQELWILLQMLQQYGHTTYLPGIENLLRDLRNNAHSLHQTNPLERDQNNLLQKPSLFYQVEEYHGRKGLLPVFCLSPNLFDPRLLQGTGAIIGNRIRVHTDTLENSAAIKANEIFKVKAREMIVFTETKKELGPVNKKYNYQELTPYIIPEKKAEIESTVIELKLESLSVVGATILAKETFKADVKQKAVVEALQTQEVISISKKIRVLVSQFLSSEIYSEGTMNWKVGSLDLKGSNLGSIKRLSISAKKYVNIRELADQFISNWNKKRSFKRFSYSSNAVKQYLTVVQRSIVQSLMEDVIIRAPSLPGSVSTLAAGRDIKLKGEGIQLKGKVFRNENNIRSSNAAFFEISRRRTKFNTNQIEPFIVVAGRDFDVETVKDYEEEGNIIKTGRYVNQKANGNLITKGLSAEQKSKTKGHSIGLQFFGSQAVTQLINGNNRKSLLALAQEEPLVARLYNLYGQQGNTEVFKQAVHAAIEIAQLVKQLTHYGVEAFGSRWGITDDKGEFNPTISLNYNHFKNTSYSKIIVPSKYDARGGIRRTAGRNQEILDGAQFRAQENIALNAGNQLILKNGEEINSVSSKSWGVGVTMQPLSGNILGGNVHMEGNKSGETHHLPVIIRTPASITLTAGRAIEAVGVNAEAGNLLEAEAPEIEISSDQETSSSSSYHVNLSGSTTSFNMSLGAKQSKKVGTVYSSWIGRKRVNIKAPNKLNLKSVEPSSPEGIVTIISPQIIRETLYELNKRSNFSLGIQYEAKSDFPCIIEWDKGIIAIPNLKRMEKPLIKIEAPSENPQTKEVKQSISVTQAENHEIAPLSLRKPDVRVTSMEKRESSKALTSHRNPETLQVKKSSLSKTSQGPIVVPVSKKEAPSAKRESASFVDLMEMQERVTTIDLMMKTRLFAMAYEGLDYAFSMGLKATHEGAKIYYQTHPFVRMTKMAYQSHPKLQKICGEISRIASNSPTIIMQEMKQVYKKNSPQFLNDIGSYLGKETKKYSEYRNKRFERRMAHYQQLGISAEMTRQYDKDTSKILGDTTLMFAAGPILKSAERTLKFVNGIFQKDARKFTVTTSEVAVQAVYQPSGLPVPYTRKKSFVQIEMEKVNSTWEMKSFFKNDAGSGVNIIEKIYRMLSVKVLKRKSLTGKINTPSKFLASNDNKTLPGSNIGLLKDKKRIIKANIDYVRYPDFARNAPARERFNTTNQNIKAPFVLINPRPPKIISTKPIKKISDTDDLLFAISKRDDQTSIAYISWIENNTKKKSLSSHVSRTLKQIKNEAVSNGSTKLEIEFHKDNNKLLRFFHKKFQFLGSSPTNHLGETIEEFEYISCHRFAVNLQNHSISSIPKKIENITHLMKSFLKDDIGSVEIPDLLSLLKQSNLNAQHFGLDPTYFPKKHGGSKGYIYNGYVRLLDNKTLRIRINTLLVPNGTINMFRVLRLWQYMAQQHGATKIELRFPHEWRHEFQAKKAMEILSKKFGSPPKYCGNAVVFQISVPEEPIDASKLALKSLATNSQTFHSEGVSISVSITGDSLRSTDIMEKVSKVIETIFKDGNISTQELPKIAMAQIPSQRIHIKSLSLEDVGRTYPYPETYANKPQITVKVSLKDDIIRYDVEKFNVPKGSVNFYEIKMRWLSHAQHYGAKELELRFNYEALKLVENAEWVLTKMFRYYELNGKSIIFRMYVPKKPIDVSNFALKPLPRPQRPLVLEWGKMRRVFPENLDIPPENVLKFDLLAKLEQDILKIKIEKLHLTNINVDHLLTKFHQITESKEVNSFKISLQNLPEHKELKEFLTQRLGEPENKSGYFYFKSTSMQPKQDDLSFIPQVFANQVHNALIVNKVTDVAMSSWGKLNSFQEISGLLKNFPESDFYGSAPVSFKKIQSDRNSNLVVRDSKEVLDPVDQGKSGNPVYMVLHPEKETPFVIKAFSSPKQFVMEVIAIKTYKMLNFSRTSFHEIVALGKFKNNRGEERGIMALSGVPGISMALDMKQTGMLPLGSAKRSLSVEKLGDSAEMIGDFLAECHEKSLHTKNTASLNFILREIDQMNRRWKIVQELGLELPIEVLEIVNTGLRQNPGIGGFVHGDVHMANFFVDAKRLYAIDLQSLARSIDKNGNPIGVSIRDYEQVLVSLRAYGMLNNLSKKEIDSIIYRLEKIYKQKFPRSHTNEARLFYRIFWNLDVLIRSKDNYPEIFEEFKSRFFTLIQKVKDISLSENTSQKISDT